MFQIIVKRRIVCLDGLDVTENYYLRNTFIIINTLLRNLWAIPKKNIC